MNSTNNRTYYGMFRCNAKEVIDYTNKNSVLLIKRLRILGSQRKECTVSMYGQYANTLIKSAMCIISFMCQHKAVSYCGTLKAAEKTFRAMQKALEKQCMK